MEARLQSRRAWGPDGEDHEVGKSKRERYLARGKRVSPQYRPQSARRHRSSWALSPKHREGRPIGRLVVGGENESPGGRESPGEDRGAPAPTDPCREQSPEVENTWWECAPLPRDLAPREQRQEGRALETGTDRQGGKPLEGHDPTAFSPLAGTMQPDAAPHAFGSDGNTRTRFGCGRFGIHGDGHSPAKVERHRADRGHPTPGELRSGGARAQGHSSRPLEGQRTLPQVSRRCRRNTGSSSERPISPPRFGAGYGRNPRAQGGQRRKPNPRRGMRAEQRCIAR